MRFPHRDRIRELERTTGARQERTPQVGPNGNGRGNGAKHISEVLEALDLRSLAASRITARARPTVRGKFFYVGDEKLYVKGVTYGTFACNSNGDWYPEPEVVARDFAQMAASGVNTVRTYVLPPRWLLDLAQKYGLRVIVGILWEQYECLPERGARIRSVRRKVGAAVRACAGHPAVLAYSIGNEIPSSIVRWHGAQRVERLLHQLYDEVKRVDRDALVTYVNYPTTEYLDLPFLDFVSFNVYLESPPELEAYLARLQNIAGDRPLVMAEVGLDSRRNGEGAQAAALDSQIRAVFAAGCAGACVFAWTDEWHRVGCDVEDWDFGLVRRDRQPKPALAAVRNAFSQVPFPRDVSWPSVSVVVCSYNGSRTIRESLERLAHVDYPNFEVIVVDDGSTDDTATIAREFDVRLIRTENRGLSSARNTGIHAARGEIVAFLDDDAWPDPHWLQYLAHTFRNSTHAAVGGPNIAPAGDGPIAKCVANAPGGPIHVLVSDQEAEHVPGCNLAGRRTHLIEVGGFDAQFRVAGDDVDLCWKLQARGWSLGFSHAGMVWHHRRNSVRAYWKQQVGYGKAEALLARKWPEKYNLAGHARWSGRLYGVGLLRSLASPRHIYHGSWGSAPYQSVYEPAPEGVRALLLMPEWYLAVAALAMLSAVDLFLPFVMLLPLFALSVGATIVQAVLSANAAMSRSKPRGARHSLRSRGLCTALYLLQPAARLWGRMQFGLTPWRRRTDFGFLPPAPRTLNLWTEVWRAPEEALREIETRWRDLTECVQRGGNFDRWDLQGWSGVLGSVRALMVVEEHGSGKQLFRFRIWPRVEWPSCALLVLLAGLTAVAFIEGATMPATILAALAVLLVLETFLHCATATQALFDVLTDYARATSAHVIEHDGSTARREPRSLPPITGPDIENRSRLLRNGTRHSLASYENGRATNAQISPSAS
jgi:GT2 family glycosyltransferase